jgi:hypothetical protein
LHLLPKERSVRDAGQIVLLSVPQYGTIAGLHVGFRGFSSLTQYHYRRRLYRSGRSGVVLDQMPNDSNRRIVPTRHMQCQLSLRIRETCCSGKGLQESLYCSRRWLTLTCHVQRMTLIPNVLRMNRMRRAQQAHSMPNSSSAQLIQVLAGHENDASILAIACLPVPLHNHVGAGARQQEKCAGLALRLTSCRFH